MAEVFFYHLTRTPLEVTLPDLLEKTLSRDWKAVVRGTSAQRLEWLDKVLWTASDDSFLPHGLAGGEQDADQPILLTTSNETPNLADILMAVDGAEVDVNEVSDFSRVCIIFDGNDEVALNGARAQWKTLTDAGVPATYWSQESGNWAKKASKNT